MENCACYPLSGLSIHLCIPGLIAQRDKDEAEGVGPLPAASLAPGQENFWPTVVAGHPVGGGASTASETEKAKDVKSNNNNSNKKLNGINR